MTISNKILVTDTKQAFGTTDINSPILVRAKSTNANEVYIGDIDVTTAAGFILEAGDALVFENVANLNHLYAVADTTESGWISWIVLNP
jgi:hypothetical protein